MSANANVKSTTESASPSSPEKVEDGTVHAVNIDPVLEKKILRKFDMLVMPQFVIIILLAYLDRSNIGKPLQESIVCVTRSNLKQAMLASLASKKIWDSSATNSPTCPASFTSHSESSNEDA